jgi:hypothetical protein
LPKTVKAIRAHRQALNILVRSILPGHSMRFIFLLGSKFNEVPGVRRIFSAGEWLKLYTKSAAFVTPNC